MKDAAYCVKCRKMTKTTEVQNNVSKNDRRIVKGMCVKCGSKKSRFIRGKVQKGGDFVNSSTRSTRLLDVLSYHGQDLAERCICPVTTLPDPELN